MAKYFGTDGVRGVANTPPITSELALRLGQAAAQVFRKHTKHTRPTVVIGKDTRLSGYMLESALQSGFTSMGFYCLIVGPLPTPAVAMLAGSLRADLGVMVTASHNEFMDNGIKLFSADGVKIFPKMRDEIEHLMENPEKIELASPDKIGKAVRLDDAIGRYTEFCKMSVPKSLSLEGMRIVIDCANGAAYKIAPKVLWELGAQVVRIGCEPDGHNINRACGAVHPEAMCETVIQHGADLGISLDGDADRLIMCDEKGKVMDGDQIIAAIATYMHKNKRLRNGVVGTVMSNMGMEDYLGKLSIPFLRTPVGDHHVEQAMREHGHNIGGESSGHIIFSDYATTGDGLLAALQFLDVMKELGVAASKLGSTFKPFPQKLHNIRVESDEIADKILNNAKVKSHIKGVEKSLSGKGRVLIRKSGTEPLVRVMVEANQNQLVEDHTRSIVEAMELVIK
jgi:phosphoglucosamine mutase